MDLVRWGDEAPAPERIAEGILYKSGLRIVDDGREVLVTYGDCMHYHLYFLIFYEHMTCRYNGIMAKSEAKIP